MMQHWNISRLLILNISTRKQKEKRQFNNNEELGDSVMKELVAICAEAKMLETK